MTADASPIARAPVTMLELSKQRIGSATRPVLRIVVYGTPAPQGSKRFVGVRGGRGTMIESSEKVRPWRQDVKAAARDSIENPHLLPAFLPGSVNDVPRFPMDGPLRARMVFTLPKPTSAPKTKRTYPNKKPDLSKLVRSTEDALTDAGLWRDDARVIEYTRIAKVFPHEDTDALDAPGCVIEVWHA